MTKSEARVSEPIAIRDDQGLLQILRHGLSKTRSALTGRLDSILLRKKEITSELLEELEELLYTSDMGVSSTRILLDSVREEVDRKELKDPQRLKSALKDHVLDFLKVPPISHSEPGPNEPWIIMVVGVNGVGKTTTIAKAAHKFRAEGKTVLLTAADTFRAAAVEQLRLWGERVGAEVISQRSGADPSAVVFDALTSALAKKADLVLIDTAGRLHTKKNLMDELRKMCRVAGTKLPGAPHEVWLVVDATTGQNAVSQARLFNEALGVTSLILTKLDGTAKGGIVVGICHQLRLPVKYIGIGENMDDLCPFDASKFVEAIFG